MSDIFINEFKEKIGNQIYHQFDTVYCVSLHGTEYSGFLYNVGTSSYVEIRKNNISYEFRYRSINPLRLVLIEKFISNSIKDWKYEHTIPIDWYKLGYKNKII